MKSYIVQEILMQKLDTVMEISVQEMENFLFPLVRNK